MQSFALSLFRAPQDELGNVHYNLPNWANIRVARGYVVDCSYPKETFPLEGALSAFLVLHRLGVLSCAGDGQRELTVDI